METSALSDRLIEVLAQMYGSEVFVNLMEFCQGELRVLLWLEGDRPAGEKIPTAMAQALHVTKGRITAALSSLKRKGYVTLTASEKDRRKVMVELTPEGRAYIEARSRQAQQLVASFVDKIGDQRAGQLVEILSLTV